jgi:hypothetical protein
MNNAVRTMAVLSMGKLPMHGEVAVARGIVEVRGCVSHLAFLH